MKSMKSNGNNTKCSDYYLGLDVGTNSVGWAVTDSEYNVLRFKGNSMWGVRLFDEANDASERRRNRTARRRLERCKQRLQLLEILFSNAVCKVDPSFFMRLHESSLHMDDKSAEVGKYALFNDADFTDKDYLSKYPTIYHLRSALIHSSEPRDIRLVFLALHHIIKNRGHFLFDGDAGEESKPLTAAVDDFFSYIEDEYGVSVAAIDRELFEGILSRTDMGITAKKKALTDAIRLEQEDDQQINTDKVIEILSGASIKLSELFCDESLKEAEIKSISLKSDLDDCSDELSEQLGDRLDLILEAKALFDTARLAQILG